MAWFSWWWISKSGVGEIAEFGFTPTLTFLSTIDATGAAEVSLVATLNMDGEVAEVVAWGEVDISPSLTLDAAVSEVVGIGSADFTPTLLFDTVIDTDGLLDATALDTTLTFQTSLAFLPFGDVELPVTSTFNLSLTTVEGSGDANWQSTLDFSTRFAFSGEGDIVLDTTLSFSTGTAIEADGDIASTMSLSFTTEITESTGVGDVGLSGTIVFSAEVDATALADTGWDSTLDMDSSVAGIEAWGSVGVPTTLTFDAGIQEVDAFGLLGLAPTLLFDFVVEGTMLVPLAFDATLVFSMNLSTLIDGTVYPTAAFTLKTTQVSVDTPEVSLIV